VLSNVHAGILTSEFEGMPFSVLETIGAGRPVCAIHLPQLATVIKDGVSGMLVARSANEDDMAERLANAFVEIRARMLAGTITPEGVAREIGAFTPAHQLAKVYENHRDIQRRRYGLVPAGPVSA
jgi:glycosyltransferase involved in cell wall biosynthesis